jgi:hypothetical protein
MDPASQRLARQQADHTAVITALRAVRERLRGQRISARTDDPQALAQAAFMLIDITVAVMLTDRQEAGHTKDEARAEAIEWLDAQLAYTKIELLESGAVYNPATSVLGYGIPREEHRPLTAIPLPRCPRGKPRGEVSLIVRPLPAAGEVMACNGIRSWAQGFQSLTRNPRGG